VTGSRRKGIRSSIREVGEIQKLEKASVITELADQLRSEGSWCGETHLQKAVYLLQELLGVQLGYDFVLYRFGPFSFDLRDDLTELQADELLEPLPSPPYGPSLVPTDISRRLRSRVSISKQDADKIHFVASRLQDKWVTDLESLATALYVWKTEGIDSVDGIAREVQKLKPHVSDEQAYKAAEEFLQIAKDSESFRN
jgi:uncharacterized protein YwgA